MFEWHGWVNVQASASVDDDWQAELAQGEAVAVIRTMVDERQGRHNEFFDLQSFNGSHHLLMAGDHNRDVARPVEFFQAVARTAPGSYGVLHTIEHDDGGPWNRWVMKRGVVLREVEQSLSPHRGAVEDVQSSD